MSVYRRNIVLPQQPFDFLYCFFARPTDRPTDRPTNSYSDFVVKIVAHKKPVKSDFSHDNNDEKRESQFVY